MNIVFMGTPEFAVPCLKALIGTKHTVSGVFTQPDKPKGRGYTLTPPPVKAAALEAEIPVYQPVKMRDGEALGILRTLAPDLIVVTAYGKILPKEILELPRFGCINIHASLLPRYRGAAPIQWSVLHGEPVTGVTSMQMAQGLDTGDMLLKKETPIGENETAGELHDRLSVIGAEVLLETLDALEAGTLVPQKQDDARSTYASMLTKDLCPMDWSRPAQELHNQVRGLSPWPVALTTLNGRRLKVHRTKLTGLQKSGVPGEVASSEPLTVVCGDGACLELVEVQAEGKKRMKAEDFLRGCPVKAGTVLGAD